MGFDGQNDGGGLHARMNFKEREFKCSRFVAQGLVCAVP